MDADFRFGGGSAFCRAAFSLVRGGGAFFQEVFAKNGVFAWCFCGEVVVNCVVNRGALMAAFWRLKICHCFELYFSWFSLTLFFLVFSYFIFFSVCEAMG
jgi:hypothetical protein